MSTLIPNAIMQNMTLQELRLPMHSRISGRSSLSTSVWYIANNRSRILLFPPSWQMYAASCNSHANSWNSLLQASIDQQNTRVFSTLSFCFLSSAISQPKDVIKSLLVLTTLYLMLLRLGDINYVYITLLQACNQFCWMNSVHIVVSVAKGMLYMVKEILAVPLHRTTVGESAPCSWKMDEICTKDDDTFWLNDHAQNDFWLSILQCNVLHQWQQQQCLFALFLNAEVLFLFVNQATILG